MLPDKYAQRGVSAGKEEVHAAIKNLDKGLFPKAFCKILPDYVGNDADFCNIMHADTAGTKTALAYLYWRETGDVSVWRNIVQDALVMNLDDMAAVGCVDNVVISNTIGRNKHLISGEVLQEIISGTQEFCQSLEKWGIHLHLSGGETADVGDIVRTIDIGFTTFARMQRSDLVINDIQAGNVVVGLASFGKTTYENAYSSGIGSNGLTSARHDVLHKHYAQQYSEVCDPATPKDLVFSGSKSMLDASDIDDMTVGQLLLSPTRTYLPVLQEILAQHRSAIKGIIHCTGGGQTKVLHFIDKVLVVKNNLFRPPPVFQLIREESKTPWREMYKVFNMGHRMEIYTDEKTAQAIIAISKNFDLAAQIVGYCEASPKAEVVLRGEEFEERY
ncbi:MAG: AIR synthase-related protein [Chitinophagales bacterium]|nr:phosphoribosylformylglycinamidine cyclo-ligase [Bacteroidota bacterium]MCB9042672.1 phosphoribosylformylglycinamidine cyclo-ligase [Chitinophagales bacterium]